VQASSESGTAGLGRREEVVQMIATTEEIQAGMKVVGSDGYDVGTVKAVRPGDFKIDMKYHRDTYAPLSAVDRLLPDQVVLNMPAAQAYREHWPTK
jgi:hypothetical protein